MPDLGNLFDKAKDALSGHQDKVEEGVDKAKDFAKDKFGHDDQIDSAADKAEDKLGDQQDDER